VGVPDRKDHQLINSFFTQTSSKFYDGKVIPPPTLKSRDYTEERLRLAPFVNCHIVYSRESTMNKLFPVSSLVVLMFVSSTIPALASPIEQQSVSQRSRRVAVPKGQKLNDAQLKETEGEFLPLFVITAGIGAAKGVGFQYLECQARGQSCTAEDYAWSAGFGALDGVPFGAAVSGGRQAYKVYKNGQRIQEASSKGYRVIKGMKVSGF
jgi:hypothetical protein